MAQGNRAAVRMQFNDGTVFSEWLSLESRDTWTDPLGMHKFEAAPGRARIPLYQEHLKKGELVTLFVNNANQGGFLIQTVTTRVSAKSGVTFSVECQTPLITPYQGSVDPKLSFKGQADAPIADIVLKALGPYGFDTEIDGDNTANVSAITGKPLKGGASPRAVDELKQDQCAAQEGETAYQFCARLLTRYGVALHCNVDGALIIRAPDYGHDPVATLIQSADPNAEGDRFIDDIEIVDTNDDQFSECRVRGNPNDQPGQTQTALPDATVPANYLSLQRPAYKSSTAASYKPLIIKDKNARDRSRCVSVAKLAMGIRAKDAFTISGTVDGFVSTTGYIWTAGTMVNVRIEAIGFDEPMWILERTLTQDRNGGQKTRLKLIVPGSLVLGDAPGGG